MRNMVGNGGVECGVEWWCEMFRRTVMWNDPENGFVKYGGEL